MVDSYASYKITKVHTLPYHDENETLVRTLDVESQWTRQIASSQLGSLDPIGRWADGSDPTTAGKTAAKQLSPTKFLPFLPHWWSYWGMFHWQKEPFTFLRYNNNQSPATCEKFIGRITASSKSVMLVKHGSMAPGKSSYINLEDFAMGFFVD